MYLYNIQGYLILKFFYVPMCFKNFQPIDMFFESLYAGVLELVSLFIEMFEGVRLFTS